MPEPVDTVESKNQGHQASSFVSLVVNILIPALILMRFSGEDQLGPVNGLLLALAFPVSYGLHDLVRHRNINLVSVLGLISVLLTGGIGLLQLDVRWLAVKEAGIPFIIGLVVLGSLRTPYPLVKTLVAKVIDAEKVQQALEARDTVAAYEKRLTWATYLIAASFFLSSALNFALVRVIVVSPPGTSAFNEELGRMTALSLPVIAVPCLIVTAAALAYLFSGIQKLTGLDLQSIVR